MTSLLASTSPVSILKPVNFSMNSEQNINNNNKVNKSLFDNNSTNISEPASPDSESIINLSSLENNLRTISNDSFNERLLNNPLTPTKTNSSQFGSPAVSPIRRVVPGITSPIRKVPAPMNQYLSPPKTFNGALIAASASALQNRVEDSFNDNDYTSFSCATQHKTPPPAPTKGKRPPKREYDALQAANTTITSPYVRESNQLQYVNCNGQQVNFTISAIAGARGHFNQLFSISNCDEQLVPGIDNNQVLLKKYHETGRATAGRCYDRFIDNALRQYDQLKDLGDAFPVAVTYNRNTAKQDGFFLVEYIPYNLPSFAHFRAVDEMDGYTKSIFDQIKNMFAQAQENSLPIDLRHDNLMVKDGKVILVDLMESHEDAWCMLVDRNLNSFVGDDRSSPMRAYLDPRVS